MCFFRTFICLPIVFHPILYCMYSFSLSLHSIYFWTLRALINNSLHIKKLLFIDWKSIFICKYYNHRWNNIYQLIFRSEFINNSTILGMIFSWIFQFVKKFIDLNCMFIIDICVCVRVFYVWLKWTVKIELLHKISFHLVRH